MIDSNAKTALLRQTPGTVKILIVYGTTEGQTRKIARFLTDRFTDAGHTVELTDATEPGEIDPSRFDKAILAASVHVGEYQSAIIHFATEHSAALSAMPSAFLSVSLAAASDDPNELQDIERIARDFTEKTGWTPGEIVHVVGAFRFTRYDFFKSWTMRYIASRKGVTVDPKEDLELTDWEALEQFAIDFAPRAPKVSFATD